VAGTGGMLMGADHCAIHPDGPVRAFGHIGLSAQLVQDPSQGAVT